MAATPQSGTMTFRGLRSKKTYIVDIYVSDVASALVTFDAGAGASATTPTEWRPPEPVVLTDLAIVTGTADTTKLQLQRSNQPTGDILRYTMHLSTNARRPDLLIGFGAGSAVRAQQLA